jgi:hypothetical protein
MNSKVKALGGVVVALMAIGVLGTSVSQAAELHAGSVPVQVTGTQEGSSNAFDIQFGEVKCTTVDYNTTTTVKTTTTVTLTPIYSGCTFAGVAATIDLNGCDYTMHITSADTGTITTECPVGQEITVTGGTKCIVHVPGGVDVGTVTLTNIGSAESPTAEITAHLSGLTAVPYKQTPGTGVGKCSEVSAVNGKITGTATFTGEVDGGSTHIGIFVT